jgi:WbqC-like protein family
VRWITLPVLRAPYSQPINQRRYQLTTRNTTKLLRQVEAAYEKAPRFVETFLLYRTILAFEDANVAAFNFNLLARLATEIGIRTRLLRSSEITKDCRLSGQDRVVEICRQLGASRYINLIGGAHLYDERRFAEAGLRLSFLYSEPPSYRQFDGPHIPSLSVIDALMFNDLRAMNWLMRSSRLLDAADLGHEIV